MRNRVLPRRDLFASPISSLKCTRAPWICPSCRVSQSRATTLRRTYATTVAAADLQFGQPLHETHPHLLEAGELTPGIPALEYANRRTALAQKLPANSIAVVAAAEVKYKSGVVFYPFHQDSNFFYLTGFNEPEALAVIAKSSDPNDHTFHLYARPKDPKSEMWEGPRSGLDAATDVFNADETGPISHLPTLLPALFSSASTIYTDIAFTPTSTKPSTSLFTRFLNSLKSTSPSTSSSPTTEKPLSSILASRNLKPLKPLVHDLRAFKSENEIRLMRGVGQATGRSFQGVMSRQWEYENEIEAWMEYDFRRRGMDGNAYVPVIAGGKNAQSIHYTRNDDALSPADLLLLDAGAEKGHYITDVTRTFPVSGKFSPAQRDLYTAVLNAQRTCVNLCREDAGVSLDKVHEITENELRKELTGLGFDVRGKNLGILFPHHVGHYIGLDVHDTPNYSRSGPLKEGQCITIEP
ncbi:hypothetical protein MMC10_001745, partial [Thelotrema lepadinum]|nr:hypothetical protein [Thelotrema lepadinum]